MPSFWLRESLGQKGNNGAISRKKATAYAGKTKPLQETKKKKKRSDGVTEENIKGSRDKYSVY